MMRTHLKLFRDREQCNFFPSSINLPKMPPVKKRKVAKEAPAPVEESDASSTHSQSGDEAPNPDEVDTSAEDTTTAAPKTFKELGIIDSLCEACETMGYKAPTPIQAESIPLALQGRDLIGLAETGSGKTAAFALPILQALMEKPQPLFSLVLAPTRELAYQISLSFETLGSTIGVRTAVIVGGMDMVPQSIALGKKPHIIVATPGRLLDHLENTKGFSLRGMKYLYVLQSLTQLSILTET